MLGLYRKYVPESVRHKIWDRFLKQITANFEQFSYWFKGLYTYLFSPFFPKNEYYDAYRFVGKYGVSVYPFQSSLKYRSLPVKILYDKELPYIKHQGNNLYFPAELSERTIQQMYRDLIVEQDEESPHKYVKSYDELRGKTLLDIGASEGIFTLEAIDYILKAYLFECEDLWIKPLQATFKPWKEKVEIIQKYVGDCDEEKTITLDSFMKGKEQANVHLKMDIEGSEMLALQGAKTFLTNGKNFSFSVCTYHKKDDVKTIPAFFESLGYKAEFTKKYLYYARCMRKAIYRGKNKFN